MLSLLNLSEYIEYLDINSDDFIGFVELSKNMVTGGVKLYRLFVKLLCV
jgi:hypothetical protein